MGKTSYLLRLANADYDEACRIAKAEDVSLAHVLKRAIKEHIQRLAKITPERD